MKTAIAVRTRSGPSRLHIAVAVAWMILTLAIGGAVAADSKAESDTSSTVTSATEP